MHTQGLRLARCQCIGQRLGTTTISLCFSTPAPTLLLNIAPRLGMDCFSVLKLLTGVLRIDWGDKKTSAMSARPALQPTRHVAVFYTVVL